MVERETTISKSQGIPARVHEDSGVPSSLQDAMNVFVTGIMGMRFKTDARKETIIAVDEAAVFLRNPKLALFLLRTLTQGRSYNIALWLATQQTADLVKANVDSEFKTNISISIILGNMRKNTLDHVKAFYKLNEADTNDLMVCGVGEGLLLVGDEVIPTKFKPTEHEMAVIKGKQPEKKTVNEIVIADSLFSLVHPGLKDLINDHQIYVPDWFAPGQDCQQRSNFPHFQRDKIPQLTILDKNPRIGNYDRNGEMVYDKRDARTGF